MARHSSVKWITCKSCNHEYSNELQRCPSCGKSAPLSLSKALGAVSIAAVAVIAVSGIILGFTEKKHTDIQSKQAVSSAAVSAHPTASSQSDSKHESTNIESPIPSLSQSSSEKTSAIPSASAISAVSSRTETSAPEQSSTGQAPQSNVRAVETADIVLPDFFSANDGLKSCRDQYRPLSFIPLVSGMKNSAYNYNKPFAADYIFELGGDGIEKRLSYIYRVQFSLCDIKSAKEKFQKHIDDNSDFFRKQLALYKEYSSDVTGIEIIFKSDISNQTLASKIFS